MTATHGDCGGLPAGYSSQPAGRNCSYICGAFLILTSLGACRTKDSIETHAVGNPFPSAATPCSVYASASGNDQNPGDSPASPKTFAGAAAISRPGSVVCVLGGTYPLSSTFKPPTSGTPSAWIIYRSYDETPVKFVWAGTPDASPMFGIDGADLSFHPAYLEFRGLNLDGGGKAGDGFFCRSSHHLRFIANSISNTGGSGIGTIKCDYITVDHNMIYDNGYMPAHAGSKAKFYSWTSGISLNSNQWFDSYEGFHNIISNNIVAGEVDQSSKHSDGNGIILDLSNRTYKRESANTPPALVVNNVVYANGGRCIEAYIVTNFWIVNNTCYRNNLDSSIAQTGSVVINNAHDGYAVNNIVVAGSTSGRCYVEENATQNIHYYRNLCFGGTDWAGLSHQPQMIKADPLFVNPPIFHPRSEGEYDKGLAPSSLGNGLMLHPSSPAISKGVDPASIPNLSQVLNSDLKQYIYTDINGIARPQGGTPDLGAYQRTSGH